MIYRVLTSKKNSYQFGIQMYSDVFNIIVITRTSYRVDSRLGGKIASVASAKWISFLFFYEMVFDNSNDVQTPNVPWNLCALKFAISLYLGMYVDCGKLDSTFGAGIFSSVVLRNYSETNNCKLTKALERLLGWI